MEKNIKEAMNDLLIEKALLLYDIDKNQFKSLGGFENFVYEYEKDDISYILRFVHSTHRTFDLVLAEIEFIDYLYSNGANVSRVVKSVNNAVSEKCNTENSEYFTITAFVKAKGDFVKRENIGPKLNKEFGRAVGKLHLLTKNYKPNHKRHHWYKEDFLDIGRRNLKEEDMYMIDKGLNLIKKLKTLQTDIDGYGLIHTDLHFGNMFYDGNDFTFFDFDDSSYKHFISDIAIIIFYQFGLSGFTDSQKEEKTFVFLNDFCEGYLEVNNLDFSWFDHLNDFLKLRELILYMVIHGAGEEMINSPYGKRYIGFYGDRIKNDVPFFDYKKAIGINKWNL